ncbi:helix-turn-helix transcriptional regulator [Vibrio sp. SCSIO 43137]|uniref:helix-turn-helix transcriptional regulator n=1 Tax=Vibrio sp. SCSIO 43137 TaxID=3021011 RepID=UPI00230787A9|nr:helix-turn-helix domain-containing protein [Vibrio sp. SCSIO 43137]WCE32643.1 helix-turn-helix domain-containing protein [Vibrio sp. SCSIO 43137]WCE32649.1 helix-turn-helix domain-containing protein [Vibrio sp. SCSIO 43137]
MKIMLQDVLKETREIRGLKQSEIAEYVGVTPQTYMKWENGKNEPKASHLKKLAEILKVSEIEMCRGKRNSESYHPIEFMKNIAKYQRYIDSVTFTSILFDYIEDKSDFIDKLEEEIKSTHGFTGDEIKYLSEDEKISAHGYKKAIDIVNQSE